MQGKRTASKKQVPSKNTNGVSKSTTSKGTASSGGGQAVRSSSRNPWRIVFVVAAVVFAVAVVVLAFFLYSYFQGEQRYDQLAEHANVDASAQQDNAFTLASMSVDWDELKAINSDLVGWIYVPHTKINYPVVRAEDNSYYISHDFDGAEGALTQFGAIFMDTRNNPDLSDEGYFIYGHHMNDGSMFAPIAAMADQQKFDEARTVYFLTPRGNLKLRSFSLLSWSADDSLVKTNFETDQERTDYVQVQIDSSIVNPGSIPPAQDITKFFAFVTCNSATAGRYVLYAYVDESTIPGIEAAS